SCTRELRRHGSKFVRAESLPRCSTVPAASFNEGFYKVALICVFEARLHRATSPKPHRSAKFRARRFAAVHEFAPQRRAGGASRSPHSEGTAQTLPPAGPIALTLSA